MLIKFLNTQKKRIICKVDNQPILLKQDGDDVFAYSNLQEGPHYIKITQKTLYFTPFCYLNVLNPIFYIWQLRFLQHRPQPQKHIVLTTFCFEVCDKENAFVFFDISQKTHGTYCIVKKRGLKDSFICKQDKDSLQMQRYKTTYICSSVFYMILLNVLSFIEGFSNGKIGEAVLFCVFISFFSLANILRISKE